jgi:Leucine-rich repeat (LRR) protein
MIIDDIFRIIYNLLDYRTQCATTQVSKYYNKYHITNLFEDPPIENLNDTILLKLYHIVALNISGNKLVTNINHMFLLKKLYANDICIENMGLYGGDDIWKYCELQNDGLHKLTNLTELSLIDNGTITDINYLVNLRILNASGEQSVLKDKGIYKLTNLRELTISFNKDIKNIRHFTKLKKLYMQGTCKINNEEISHLTNLIELNANGNKNLTDINSLIKLIKLDIGNFSTYTYTNYFYADSQISSNGISKLTNLTDLYIDGNEYITNIDTLINLTKLSALSVCDYGIRYSGLTQNCILNLKNLIDCNIEEPLNNS